MVEFREHQFNVISELLRGSELATCKGARARVRPRRLAFYQE